MALNIKYKIRLGTLFLFLLLVLSAGTSMFYLFRLRREDADVLKDNYLSLQYAKSMQQLTDSLALNASYHERFAALVKLQSANVTEKGEGPATDSLAYYFQLYTTEKKGIEGIRHYLLRIIGLNMEAIERKNIQAQASAETGSTVLIVITSITLIVGLTFAYNFPFIITTPIRKLTEGIREIANKNYGHRIHYKSNDEMGQLADAFNRMSERLGEFESSNLNKIIFEKTRAEAVINSLKDASIGIDRNNRVLFANRQALQLLGIDPVSMIGLPVADVAVRNDLFRYVLQHESSAPFKIIVSGKENYYIREIVEVNEGESRVIVLKNITSFKELDAAKTNFIATVSHELKTPLSSSDFSLKLLEDTRIGQLTAEQKDLIHQLKADNTRMLRILSELLNLSQVEAGKLQLDIRPVQMVGVIESSVNAVINSAREKDIGIEKQFQDNLPVIQADPDKIGWVLNNFLTNAIRYSPEHQAILVTASIRNNRFVCEVTDHGPGVDPAWRQRIFERYFQIPGRADKKGSGIGLSICKEFVEAMGGGIYVTSEPGKGSTFGFELPYARS